MNDLDRKIQAALRRDAPNDPIAEDPSFTSEVLGAFRSRQRWLTLLIVKAQIGAVLGLICVAYQVFHASDVSTQIRWSGLGAILLLVVAGIKIWFWMELHTNRVLREVKRVELLLVSRSQN